MNPIALPPGSRLGPYEIVAPIGAGGMGEVYRARDTRLHRDVAIKVLPAGSVAEPDRRTRFEQEARAAAALNHPNIVAVFDFGAEDGAPYIVSELLEGETLAERLRQGPLPARTAVDYAVQVARGLAAAHDRNIVHRDLKPANVFITTDGRAKILDFGLAKLTQPLAALPTDSVVQTTPVGTTPGMAFGTVGYMAPEQVRGQAVDSRADIFAFGVLLYEMVTGTRAFERETPPETLTAILREDVAEAPLTTRHVPAPLGRIIRRCVEKNPSGRFQSALDLAFALEATESASGSSGSMAAEPSPARAAGWRPWIIAAVVSAAAITFAMLTRPEAEAPPVAPMLRFALAPPRGEGVTLSPLAAPSLSPDGSRIAFPTGARVWVQGLDELAPRAIAPNGGGQAIFWSPDGTLLAHNLGTNLRVVDANGGNERTVCELPTQYMRGGTWNADGVIIVGAQGRGLMRCSASGGQFAALTTLNAERRESGHFGPTFLPDGKRLLYWAQPSGTVWLTSLDGGAPQELLTADSVVRYVDPGFLLFVRRGALVAQRFDMERGAVSGEPVTIIEQVLSDQGFFTGSTFDVAQSGTLVYRTGFSRGPSLLQWVDRKGQPIGGPLSAPGLYLNPSLSRDGRQLAIERIDQQTRTADILLMDFARSNVFTRFTSDPGNDTRPVWSPDGEWIAFASDRGGIENIYRKRVHGAAAEELVLQTEAIVPASWPAPSLLLYQRLAPSNLGLLTLTPTAQARILDESRALVIDRWGEVSPDGKWLAFSSQEAGGFQIYVQSFPSPDGGKWMVTRGGVALYPRWSPDGKELFLIAGDGALMSVSVSGGESPVFGVPERLFDPKTVFGSAFGQGRDQQYAVAPDGQRFLINTPTGEAAQSPMTVLVNWQKLLSQ